MRIGVLTHNYPRYPGDFSGVFVELLCRELATQGHSVKVLAPYDPAFDRRRKSYPDVALSLYRYIWPDRLHRLGYMRSMQADQSLRTNAYLLSPLLLLSGTAHAVAWARRNRLDIVHAHWTLPNGFMAAIISHILRIPLVVSVPGSDATIGAQNPFFGRLCRFVFDRAELLTANSEALRDVSVQELGADPAKFDLIPYGLDPETRYTDDSGTSELRSQLGIPQEAVVFLAVGRMVPKKGFDRLVRALGKIGTSSFTEEFQTEEFASSDATRQTPPIHLVMVGEGDCWAEWQVLAHTEGVAEFIHWVGNVAVNDMNVYYNMADVVTTPARERPATGLIVAVLEAMVCGKPVLATDVGSNRLTRHESSERGYVVEDGVTGLVVPDGNVDALARAMIRLAADPDLRRRMGERCKDLAGTELSWPHIARRYVRHFERITGHG